MKKVILAIFLIFIMTFFLSTTQLIAGPKPPPPPPPPDPVMEKLNQLEQKLNQIQNQIEVPPNWGKKITGAERFLVVMDGEGVLDKETGLVWSRYVPTRQSVRTTYYFYEAVNLCENWAHGGRYGWRLPAMEELMSLMDPGSPDFLPSGNPFIFEAGQTPLKFWSSTTGVNDVVEGVWWQKYGKAVGIGEWMGTYNLPKSDYLYVWCVRGRHGYDGNTGW